MIKYIHGGGLEMVDPNIIQEALLSKEQLPHLVLALFILTLL